VIFTRGSPLLYQPFASEIALAYTFDGDRASRISSLGASLYQFFPYFNSNAFLTLLIPLLLKPSCFNATSIFHALSFSQVIFNFS
jgi:hypothetical protein